MTNTSEKAILILVGNLNLGCSYLITTVRRTQSSNTVAKEIAHPFFIYNYITNILKATRPLNQLLKPEHQIVLPFT